MKRKLHLNRVTLRSLDAVETAAAKGGVTERGTCACPTQVLSCGISCWGTCYQHTCVAWVCQL